jgi:hypothetical protein
MMNCQRCEKYPHCRLRGDRESGAFRIVSSATARAMPETSCSDDLPVKACLQLAVRNNGHFDANIGIRKTQVANHQQFFIFSAYVNIDDKD